MSDDNTSIGPPPRRPAPRQVAPPKVRTGVTVPPGGGLRPVTGDEDLALAAMMPAVVVPPPMPRSRAPDSDPRFAAAGTAATSVEPVDAVPGTFGGPMATPTSIDSASGVPAATDRGAPLPAFDTGAAPHGSSEVGTHGGDARRRPVPAAALFLSSALVVAIGGSALVVAFTSGTAASSEAEAESGPIASAKAIEPELLMVAQVNEIDPARVLPYTKRHEALDRLATLPEAALVDRRLNLAFDLVQATDAPDPCGTFAAALDAVAADPDPTLASALETARAPSASDPACAGLDERRRALLATLSGAPAADTAGNVGELRDGGETAPVLPQTRTPAPASDAAAPGPAKSEGRPRGTKRRAGEPTTGSRAAGPPAKEPKAPGAEPVGRVNEELRPFGQ